ncbi:hypothetical protein B0H11DRAFT_2310311 [Mycena galericulata]|nr:hypothetical protein B0H11DRAFT_2310311 [Mycena galericulata]
MKQDVISKRSRHDTHQGGASASVSETPTSSPGVRRRASPAPGGPDPSASTSAGRASPTLAPDGTSELSSALGPKTGGYGHGPRGVPGRAAVRELDAATTRANKRRRMSGRNLERTRMGRKTAKFEHT